MCSTFLEHNLSITCALDKINPVCKKHYYDDYISPQFQECDQYHGKCGI